MAERKDRGTHPGGKEILSKIGKDRGTQLPWDGGKDLRAEFPLEEQKSSLLKFPPTRLDADYHTLKVHGTVFATLAEMNPKELNGAKRNQLSVLSRISDIFLDASQQSDIILENRELVAADDKEVEGLKTEATKLRDAEEAEVRKTERIIQEAAAEGRLLPMDQLATIFFHIGKSINISYETVKEMTKSLRKSEQVSVKNQKLLQKEFKNETDGLWNILTVGNRLAPRVKIESGYVVAKRQKP